MLAAGVVEPVDVLNVGHHGSNTSTSQAFLDVVQPTYGVISAGLDNQFGHPHAEVASRLTAAGVDLVYTDTTEDDNTVLVTTNYSISNSTSSAPAVAVRLQHRQACHRRLQLSQGPRPRLQQQPRLGVVAAPQQR